MGGFLLHLHPARTSDPAPAPLLKAGLRVFQQKGLPSGPVVQEDGFTLHLFGKKLIAAGNLKQSAAGFAAAVGSLFYSGKFGQAALDDILRDAGSGRVKWSELAGNYCLLLHTNGNLLLVTDPTGLYPVYYNRARTILSSSFLAVAEACDSRTPSVQEIHEYVFGSAFYGENTLLQEVMRLDSGLRWRLAPEIKTEPQDWPDADLLRNLPFPAAVEKVTGALAGYFTAIQREFGDEVCSALSGGYDSRLVLALLRKTGCRPYLYVYGEPTDPDVRIARHVAADCQLELDNVDRSQWRPLSPASLKEQINGAYAFFDGIGHEGGVFDDGRDLSTRLDRAKRVRLQLNGGGGEIYRNFWKLPTWPARLEDLITTHFDSGDFVCCRPGFERREYLERLAQKARDILKARGRRLRRDEIELLYPLMRLRFWQAKNNVLNNQLTYGLTPFAEGQFAVPASAIPVRVKNHGRFEAALITAIDRRLAALPSVYGHAFTVGPSWKKRMKTDLQMMAPASAIGWAKRRRARRRATTSARRPYWCARPYLDEILGGGTLAIDEWFDLERSSDQGVLARALTVELLLRGRRT